MKKQKTTPVNSLKEFADIKREELRLSGKLPNGLDHSLVRMCMAMGPMANLPPKQLTPANFVRVREQLLDSGLASATIRKCAGGMRQFLSELVPHGLDPACVAVFRAIRLGPVAPCQYGPAQRSHLKIILDALQSQLELLQLLIWIILSGAPPIRDTVMLEFAAINWKTGLIRRSGRIGGRKVVFGALPPLLDLLKKRRKRVGPEAVYVFPELIFAPAELGNSQCNCARLRGVNGDSQRAARDGAQKAIRLVADFIVSCGLPLASVNYKSFRAHVISLWASIGMRPGTVAGITGWPTELDGPYQVPTEFEIERLREITWKYLEAIRNDQPFFVPTSNYDIYDALMEELRKIQGEIARLKAA